MLTLLFLSSASMAQVFENATDAFQASAESGKPLLLIFSGSDWCAPCIQFERRILKDNAFLSYANDQLVILKADFPQRKRLAKALEKQNESLAERYNPQGVFPYLLLIKSDQSLATILTYVNQPPDDFIAELTAQLAKIKNGKI